MSEQYPKDPTTEKVRLLLSENLTYLHQKEVSERSLKNISLHKTW